MGFEATGWVQLATRVPGGLRRRAKLAAVASDVTLQDYVIAALEEKLARERDGVDLDERVPPSLSLVLGARA